MRNEYQPIAVSNEEKLISLENFINNYIIRQKPYIVSRCNKIGGRSIASIAFILGATAGVPWLHIGDEVSDHFNVHPMAYPIYVGLILSYGTTVAWMLMSITSNWFKQTPSEAKTFANLSRKTFNPGKDTLYHVTGLLTMIPAIYLAVEYNTNNKELYAFLTGLMTYIFSTLGVYKIDMYVRKLIVGKEHRLKTLINTALANLKDHATYDNIAPYLNLKNNDNSVNDGNRNFMTLIQKLSSIKPTKKINKKLLWLCKALLMIPFPVLNAIFRAVIIFRALDDADCPPILNYITTAFVSAPLYAINIYSMDELGAQTAIAIQNLTSSEKVKANHMTTYHPKLNIFLIMSTSILSILSAMTNGYTAYDQMQESPAFEDLAWLFGANALLLTAVFQIIGFKNVVDDMTKLLDTFRHPNLSLLFSTTSRVADLSGYLEKTDDAVLDDYENKYTT